ncbi:MATH domain-containing protein [uncultured Prochlorococcus sp.]|uniref:MATH domain-containing protein n=1 Tax=uncultured Prochlorococcus sp. TaxID=159733 RepID=UPI002588FE37|nr:MATH domain-containing protein [uncultured Prochlorococcus sp.]
MSESNNLPQAISHKKLSYLMLKAQKDSHFSDELAEIESLEKKEFDDLINNWEASTKKVINELSKRKDNLLKDRSPNSLIALGAMEVHLNMALQAFNVFNKEVDE